MRAKNFNGKVICILQNLFYANLKRKGKNTVMQWQSIENHHRKE